VTKEVIHRTSLWVDGCLYFHLHGCKVIHPSPESSDPICRTLSLVSPITDVPLQRRLPVRVPSGGGGSGTEAWPGVTLRGVVTTALMVTQVATLIPSVPLGLLRVGLWCSHGLLCYLHASSPTSVWWSYEAMACLFHLIKLDEAHSRVFPNRWSGGWWEVLCPNQPSRASSHHRQECEQTLDGGGTHTCSSPQWYRWRCCRRP
jgi:hypothetical protein